MSFDILIPPLPHTKEEFGAGDFKLRIIKKDNYRLNKKKSEKR